ncbi:MAG: L-asparaginase II [Planctomycetota bacterium]|jgi:L-asparaginase II
MLIEPTSPKAGNGTDKSQTRKGGDYPDNPVLVEHWRGGNVESQNRGAWALVRSDGELIEGHGGFLEPVFARSSTKALQALPLIESGAADKFGFTSRELALAVASHYGEPCHTEVVNALLKRLGLSTADLKCGIHRPTDPEANRELWARKEEPSVLHNNCSGKHAAFLALAQQMGQEVGTYIEDGSRSQAAVKRTVFDLCGSDTAQFSVGIDGCSAPTFRMPLQDLALAFARFANPEVLEEPRRKACERLAEAVALHPNLIGGSKNQICSAISRVTGGRLFPKIGAEAVYVIGERGGGRALALKMDDGGKRGMHPMVLSLLRRFSLASSQEIDALSQWAAGPARNYAGLEVGRTKVIE